MAYTPELSQRGSATLRRFAWYIGKPRTKILEMLIETTATRIAKLRPGRVCMKCKDKSICDQCPFRIQDNFMPLFFF